LAKAGRRYIILATMKSRRERLSMAGLALAALLPLLAPAAAAQETRSVATLCAPYFEELLATGKVTRTSDSGKVTLLPKDPSFDAFRVSIAKARPGILVETAFFLPRTDSADSSRRLRELARIFGCLTAFSSLEGIQYYSVSHKAMRTLYAESYRIDGPDSKARLPDVPAPLPGQIPGQEKLFAFQRDLSFGSNVYSYEFSAEAESVSVEVTNLTRMSYGLIPLITPRGLRTRLLVMPTDEGILFYTESDSSSAGPFRTRLEESFANRAVALFAWFSSKSATFIKRG
jgi:hypothetical protein